jgi:hypothetical protein
MSQRPTSNNTVASSKQWTKSEKREHAARQIMEARKRTHAINKKFAQQQHMK